MKVNCDAIGDKLFFWFYKLLEWDQSRYKRQMEWHKKFVIYRKIGNGDCRLFEIIERRRLSEYDASWEYRPLVKESNGDS